MTTTTPKPAPPIPGTSEVRASVAVPHLSVAERAARGRAARAEVPRSRHAVFEPSADRADPVSLLELNHPGDPGPAQPKPRPPSGKLSLECKPRSTASRSTRTGDPTVKEPR